MIELGLITGAVIVLYGIFILCVGAFFLLPVGETQSSTVQGFTVLIPFKNEEKNIAHLIRSLQKSYTQYSKNEVEFLFLNDHSIDNSLQVLEHELMEVTFEWRIVSLQNELKGKKMALILGVELAKYERIITLDADCVVASDWLSEMTRITVGLGIGVVIQHNEQMPFSVLTALQSTEGLMLQGITLGSANLMIPLLCSGANLSYSKEDFIALQPYMDNLDIASGDDMFLLEKFRKNDLPIVSAQKAIVYTTTENNWSDLIKRSSRWIAKTTQLKNNFLSGISVLTFVANLLFILSFVLWLITANDWWLFNCLIKFLVDFLLLFSVSLAFKKLYLLIFAPLIVFIYPIYLFWVGMAALSYKKKDWN